MTPTKLVIAGEGGLVATNRADWPPRSASDATTAIRVVTTHASSA